MEKRQPQAVRDEKEHMRRRGLGVSPGELLAVRTGWESGHLRKRHLQEPSGMGGPTGGCWGPWGLHLKSSTC